MINKQRLGILVRKYCLEYWKIYSSEDEIKEGCVKIIDSRDNHIITFSVDSLVRYINYLRYKQYLKKFKHKYPQFDYIGYDHTKNVIVYYCPKHKRIEQTIENHLRCCSGCPKCGHDIQAKTTRKSRTEFIQEASLVHDYYYDYSKVVYKQKGVKVEIICPKHGSFWQTPNNHLRGSGCPKCSASKGELKLIQLLHTNFPNLEVIHHYKSKWLGRQHLDVYIPKYNIGIEYNGRQHYEPIKCFKGDKGLLYTQINDKLKVDKCHMNGCTLFIIPHNNFDQGWDDVFDFLKNLNE